MLPQRLSRLGRENMNKLQQSEVRLYEQIVSLHGVTAELEKKCAEPSFLLLKVRVQKEPSLQREMRNELHS